MRCLFKTNSGKYIGWDETLVLKYRNCRKRSKITFAFFYSFFIILISECVVDKNIMAEKKCENIKLWERNGKSDL